MKKKMPVVEDSRSLFLRLTTTRRARSFVKKEKCIGAKSNLYRSTINKKKVFGDYFY